MMNVTYYTYILASRRRGALFVGVTANLADSVLEHKANEVDGVTSLYAIHMLVYYEVFPGLGPALLRQAELRRLHRRLKLRLIEQLNPDWIDLYTGIATDHKQVEMVSR